MIIKHMEMDTLMFEDEVLANVLEEAREFLINNTVMVQNMVVVEDQCQGQWFAYLYYTKLGKENLKFHI